jgi:hypothetical protein
MTRKRNDNKKWKSKSSRKKSDRKKKFTQKLCKIRKNQSIHVNVAVHVMIPATVHKQK